MSCCIDNAIILMFDIQLRKRKYACIIVDSEHCFDLSSLISAVGTIFSGLYAQTQRLPCPPFFQGRTGMAERFFAGSFNWYSYEPHGKNLSRAYCFEQYWITPTTLMKPEASKQCSLAAVVHAYLICFCSFFLPHQTINSIKQKCYVLVVQNDAYERVNELFIFS